MSTYITKIAKERKLRKMDAKQSVRIEVTKDDISKALQKNSKCCAFARAAKRMGARGAYFFATAAWIEFDDMIVRFLLPRDVRNQIRSFDKSRVMAPGIYQLNRPDASHAMTAIKRRGKKRPGRHSPGVTNIARKVRKQSTSIRTLQEPRDPSGKT